MGPARPRGVIELRRALPFLAIALVTLLAGCGLLPVPFASEVPNAPLARELAANARTWADAGITSYRFTVDMHCFCPAFGPIDVVVEDGVVASLVRDSTEIEPADAGNLPTTIPALFDVARRALEGDGVKIAYDAATGIPMTIDADPIRDAIDDEYSVVVSAFEVLPVPSGAPGGVVGEQIVIRQRQWEAQGITSYTWQATFSCECTPSGPTTITVVNGEATAVRNALVNVRPRDLEGFPLTIDALYAEAFRTLDGGGTVAATWDETTGIPRELFLDRDPRAIDDELVLTVDSLTPAP